MTRSCAGRLWLLMLAALCPLVSGCTRTPTLMERLKERPAPDLATLAERSAPGQATLESFYDILSLRESCDEQAVPVLAEILAAHAESRYIHRYAAAQALHCIGTPKCHEILSEHVLKPSYCVSYAIDLMPHWSMDPAKRDDFIDRYHLVNLSRDLELSLKAERKDGGLLVFTVVLKNASGKAFSVMDQLGFPGRMLFFRTEGGEFVRSFDRTKCLRFRAGPVRWIELAPGAEHTYRAEAKLVAADELARRRLPARRGQLVLDVAGTAVHRIPGPGRYKVYAMVEAQPPTEVQQKAWKVSDAWVGRAVAGPIEVQLGGADGL